MTSAPALAAATTAAFLSISPASAVPCMAQDEVVRRVMTSAPTATIRMIDGEKADRITLGIARAMGGPMVEGGIYLVISMPGSVLNAVIRLEAGCVSHSGHIPAALIARWIKGSPV